MGDIRTNLDLILREECVQIRADLIHTLLSCVLHQLPDKTKTKGGVLSTNLCKGFIGRMGVWDFKTTFPLKTSEHGTMSSPKALVLPERSITKALESGQLAADESLLEIPITERSNPEVIAIQHWSRFIFPKDPK